MLKNLSELMALKLQTGKLVKPPFLSRKKSGDEGGQRPAPSQTGGRGRGCNRPRTVIRNNPKNAAPELAMSDYIMSVTGGAVATEPLADGNAMLCSNDHLEPHI